MVVVAVEVAVAVKPPPMMSQGGFHRRLVRIRSLAERFVPTNDELATAVKPLAPRSTMMRPTRKLPQAAAEAVEQRAGTGRRLRIFEEVLVVGREKLS